MKHRSCHKAVAVCPDGNDLLFDPSGRGIRQVYFRELTAPAISATERHPDTNIRPHELRPLGLLRFSAPASTLREHIADNRHNDGKTVHNRSSNDEIPIPLLHDQTCDNKGNSDIGYSIGTAKRLSAPYPGQTGCGGGGGNRTQCIDLGESADRHPQQKAQQQQFLHLPNTRFRPHRKNLFSPLTDSRDGDGCGGGYSARTPRIAIREV